MRVIVMRLGSQGESSKDDAIRLLSKVVSPNRTAEDKKKVLSDEFRIDVTTEIDEEVDHMCNLSARILRQGLEQGLEQGLKQGIEKGRKEGIMETLFSLVKKGLLTITDAAQQVGMETTVFEKEYENYTARRMEN